MHFRTPELLETPEFKAIQSLLYDGEPEENAQNFLNHGIEGLKKANELTGEKRAMKILDAMNCL